MNKHLRNINLQGKIKAPPSKSDAQRAILVAALAHGESTIEGYGSSEDVLQMISNIQAIGAKTRCVDGTIHIQGTMEFPDRTIFNAGESGLGFRLLTAISAVAPGSYWIEAEGSLMSRPQKFVIETLNNNGCLVESRNGFPPFNVLGKINTSVIHLDASESSQFLSGLLIALPMLNHDTQLHVKHLQSTPYVHMTLKTLSKFGVQITNIEDKIFVVPKSAEYCASQYKVEGDWSGASNWLIASALGADIEIIGLEENSLQADKAVLEVLDLANCTVRRFGSCLRVDGSQKRSFDFDATNCPDLFPVLVPLAAGCKGQSKIKGVGRLQHKESNRADTLTREFGKLGLEINISDDYMIINGTGCLGSGVTDSHNDHRIAMSLAISSIITEGELIIQDASCVQKSYPNFWEDFEKLSN